MCLVRYFINIKLDGRTIVLVSSAFIAYPGAEMDMLSIEGLQSYWSGPQIEANLLILANILGALLLGMMVGYERSYHGRAAGIRTYGLVCMASSAVTVIVGYPHFWFGGMLPLVATADPTRVIQGVVTGIGFLGAGVIMKEGMSISGLTTAASIWASSAIGILCGAGFYFAAIMLTAVASAAMIMGGVVEGWLPSRHAAAVILRFKDESQPAEEEVKLLARELGYRVAEGSTSIIRDDQGEEWHLVFLATSSRKVSIPQLAAGLNACGQFRSFQVAFARN